MVTTQTRRGPFASWKECRLHDITANQKSKFELWRIRWHKRALWTSKTWYLIAADHSSAKTNANYRGALFFQKKIAKRHLRLHWGSILWKWRARCFISSLVLRSAPIFHRHELRYQLMRLFWEHVLAIMVFESIIFLSIHFLFLCWMYLDMNLPNNERSTNTYSYHWFHLRKEGRERERERGEERVEIGFVCVCIYLWQLACDLLWEH